MQNNKFSYTAPEAIYPAYVSLNERDDRVARGQTLRDEARAMGITPSELSRLERGG